MEESHPIRSASAEYVPELDGLRLLAILSVMCVHWLPARHWINQLQGGTAWGVYLFFVLSGFLITRILVRCRDNAARGIATIGHSLRQFYVRRFLRIFPLYYLLLLIGVLLNVQGVRRSIGWQVLYLTNHYFFIHKAFTGPTTPFWSLSVEEQFYLLWPLAMLVLPIRALTPFVLLSFLAGTACRCAAIFSHDPFYLILTPSCVNYLAAGALVAVVESPLTGIPDRRATLLKVYLLLALALAAVAVGLHLCRPFAHQYPIVDSLRHVCASLLFGWIIGSASGGIPGSVGKLFRFTPAVYLGKISYGLYAYHSFIKWTLEYCGGWAAHHLHLRFAVAIAENFAVRFAVTAAVASASWHLFEKPLNDLKRRFPYSHRPRPTVLEERGIPVPTPAGAPRGADAVPEL